MITFYCSAPPRWLTGGSSRCMRTSRATAANSSSFVDGSAAAAAGGGSPLDDWQRAQAARWAGGQPAADPGGCWLPGRRTAAAFRLRVVEGQGAEADSGLGQVELDIAGGFPVAGERGDHGPGLLVSGGEKERRGATVALDADRVVARFGVGELVDAVRADCAAGVVVRVDQRSQCAGRAKDRVQIEAQLGGEGVVGPESGGVDDHVGGQLILRAVEPSSGQLDAAAAQRAHRMGVEAGDDIDAAGPHVCAEAGAESAAGRAGRRRRRGRRRDLATWIGWPR